MAADPGRRQLDGQRDPQSTYRAGSGTNTEASQSDAPIVKATRYRLSSGRAAAACRRARALSSSTMPRTATKARANWAEPPCRASWTLRAMATTATIPASTRTRCSGSSVSNRSA